MSQARIHPQEEQGKLNETGFSSNQTTYRSLGLKKVVDIAFKNIEYSVVDSKGVSRQILRDLNGYCPGGEVTAILGASGAGKTSLLNILAARVQSTRSVTLKGKVLANLVEYDADTFSSFAAYVMQNDVLFETLSPREALQFVADLKYTDDEIKRQRVEETIKTMKLERCQNAIIGGPSLKGISGGEKKRTSIGFELVSNPNCILLDEPTSGLDSFTAFQIIYELTQLAHIEEKTIIFTIHQPSSDIYLLFDRIMLLVQGKFIYQGPRTKLVDYFTGIGFPCPAHSNPLDYMISIMNSENENNVKNFPKYFQSFDDQWSKVVLDEIEGSSRSDLVYKKVETTTLYQISLITKRAIKSFLRDRLVIRQRFGMAIFMGLLLGGTYYGVGDQQETYSDYASMAGLMFLLCSQMTFSSLFPVVLQFSTERDVFLREENSKLYTTFSYFMGKSFVEVPFCLITPIIQELILYWMIGLNHADASVVIAHIFIAIITCLNGNSIGLMAGCIFTDIKAATGLVPLFLLPLFAFSGFFANPKQFYIWIQWIQYVSPMKYAFEALARNEFAEKTYEFGSPQEMLGFNIGLWESVGILLAFFVFIRCMAFLFLHRMRAKQQ